MNRLLILLTFCLSTCLSLNTFADNKKLLLINSQEGDPYRSSSNAMLKRLEEAGYVAGENLDVKEYILHNREGLGQRILRLEEENQYDAVFLNGTIANKIAHKHWLHHSNFKFVFCSVTDPVGLGLIEDFDIPPKANFTGIAYGPAVEKRLQLMLDILPNTKTIGMIYADMPQSHSYINWLRAALRKPEFQHLNIIFRQIPFVHGQQGHIRMARLMEEHLAEMEPQVDVFMTPSDQMGTRREFAETVTKHTKKPLIGLSEKEIKNGWGAQFGIYAEQKQSGYIAADMIIQLFNGADIAEIVPVRPQGRIGLNLHHSTRIGLNYPDVFFDNPDFHKHIGTNVPTPP